MVERGRWGWSVGMEAQVWIDVLSDDVVVRTEI